MELLESKGASPGKGGREEMAFEHTQKMATGTAARRKEVNLAKTFAASLVAQ